MWSPMKRVGIIEPEGILNASTMLERIMKTTRRARPRETTFSISHCRRDLAGGRSWVGSRGWADAREGVGPWSIGLQYSASHGWARAGALRYDSSQPVKTLDRYLAGIFIRNFLLALVAMVLLFVFQSLLGQLIDRTYPPNQVVYYNLLHIPEILVQMAPPAVLLATVMTLSGLSRTNELVACFSIGLGLKRLVALFVT